MSLQIVRVPVARAVLASMAASQFGDMIKAVVDVRRRIMAIGGELHSDEEALLLEDGSAQKDLWGVNLYPADQSEAWIEYDSMINVRPAQGNRSRGVEGVGVRSVILGVIEQLVTA